MLKKIILPVLFACAWLGAWGAPVDDARALYDAGRYDEALEVLEPAVRRSPRDGNLNYWLGMTYIALGQPASARQPLLKARERGVTDAAGTLARLAYAEYDVDGAAEYLDDWRARLVRNRRAIPEELEEMASSLVRMRNMLERVERITVLDSIVLPRENFFRAYRLSDHAGKIIPPEGAARIAHPASRPVTTAFMPESNTEILWCEADSAGIASLHMADILDDGSAENPRPVDAPDPEGGVAFPFLMGDGMTLYYAAEGENSLGGYDIFLTRRTDDGSLMQGQNIGMPYNSPANDYLLAIDETTGLGWWATERNTPADSVTIYIFIPADVRVNVDTTSGDLAHLARLDNISMTQGDIDPHAELERRLALAVASSAPAATEQFRIAIDGETIYTRLDQFRSPQARMAMTEWLGAQAEMVQINRQLADLRQRWAAGDRSLAAEILNVESDRLSLTRRMAAMKNNVVRAEQEALRH